MLVWHRLDNDVPAGRVHGNLIAARAVTASWLTRLPTRARMSRHHDDDMYSVQALRKEIPSFPALQQAGVRYRWEGEETYGMLERSNPLDKIVRDQPERNSKD